MTVSVPGSSAESTGLEDVDASDVRIPRLNIDHKKAVFVDNLSNQEYPKLDCILLGLVKQRIMWHHEVGTDEKPLCKSPNFQVGFPIASGQAHLFPWDKSDFNENDYKSDEGLTTLPCEKCNFREWGTHADGKKPACAEQHTYPLLFNPDLSEETDSTGQNLVSALFTTQHSGIKPSRDYLSSFIRMKTPLYTVLTTVTLSQQKRGSNQYCVPVFRVGNKTPTDSYPYLSQQYRSIREFVHSTGTVRDRVKETPIQEAQPAETVEDPLAPVGTDPADLPF